MSIPIQALDQLPENFGIIRDNFGWRYSTNANSGEMSNWVTGFSSFELAISHYYANRPNWLETLGIDPINAGPGLLVRIA